MDYTTEELETINVERHKYLIIEHENLFECFVKLADVKKYVPDFKHKEKFQKSSQKKQTTKEYYVKCLEVKQSVSKETWAKILTDESINWFRILEKGHVTFVKSKAKIEASRPVEEEKPYRSLYIVENRRQTVALQA